MENFSQISKRPVWLIAGLLIGLSGCEDEHEEVLLDTDPVYLYVYEYILTYGEEHPPPVITANISTERIFTCSNYTIDVSIEKIGNKISIKLQSIEIGNICLTSLGPAKVRVPLDVQTGDYLLKIKSGADTDSYFLGVSDSTIILLPLEASFSSISYDRIYRYPEMSFVYTCDPIYDTKWYCDAYSDSLMKYLTLDETFFADSSAQWPYRRTANNQYDDTEARYFLYYTESDFDSAGAQLKRFTEKYKNDSTFANMSISNWKGWSYSSWLFDRDDL